MKLIIRTITILAIVNFYLYGLGPASVGKMALDFKLKDLKSGEYISLQDYRGKIVILDFWATWCSPCKESLPELQRLATENQSLSVLAVNIDDKKDNALHALSHNYRSRGIYPPSAPWLQQKPFGKHPKGN
jgi:thiol-disulfide isomerase/thioredoxin